MKINSLLFFLLFITLLQVEYASGQDSPISKGIAVSGKVPEVTEFTLTEGSNITLGDISLKKDYATAEGRASISSTMSWVLKARTWGTGDGYMRTADGSKKLAAQFQVKVGATSYLSLPPYYSAISLATQTPGQYSLPTGYKQRFTKGDTSGRYYITVDWIITSSF